MNRAKKIIAIMSALLLLGTAIYHVSAGEGYDANEGDYPVDIVDVGVDGEQGDFYEVNAIPEDVGDLLMDASEAENEALAEGEEINEVGEGYIGFQPTAVIPSAWSSVAFVDNRVPPVVIPGGGATPITTVTPAPNQVGINISYATNFPQGWEPVGWEVTYMIERTGGVQYPVIRTYPFTGNLLLHTIPAHIDLDNYRFSAYPVFRVFMRAINPTLTGTVTCTTCPAVGPGTPMPGVTIELHYYCEVAGDVVRTQVTNADGFFDFGQVPLGNLRLVKLVDTIPEGHLSIEPRVIEFTTATPGGTYERHFFVECKTPPNLTKTATHVNGVAFTGAPPAVSDGDLITYRLRVNNPNPRLWSNFLLVDVLPPGLALEGSVLVAPADALVSNQSGPGGVNVVLNLPAGPGAAGNVDVTFTARVTNVTLAVDGSFLNVAHLYGPPPTPGGERPFVDDCDERVPVRPPGVSIVKTVNPAYPTATVPGGNLLYTLVVRNTGGAVLTDVVVTDDLPAQLTNPRNVVVTPAAAGSGSFVGPLLTVNIPRLGLDEYVTITFEATVASGVADGTRIENIAEVTTAQNVSDEDDAVAIVRVDPPDVSLTKSVSARTIEPGGTLTYTLEVENTGGVTLTNVVVTDDLPPQLMNPRNLVINPAIGTGSFEGRLLTVTIPELEVGQIVTITFDVTVVADVQNNTMIVNVAEVTTNEGPYDEDDARVPVEFEPPILRQPDVSLTKSVSARTIEPGGTLTYTLEVENTGGVTLTNVVVTDDLPPQLMSPRNLVINPAIGTGSFEGRLLTVTIPELEVGQIVTITFDVTVVADVQNNTMIVNVAEVTTNEGPYDEDDARVPVEFEPPILRQPGISIEKSVSSGTVAPGGNLTYTLVVRNTGNVPLTNAVVRDNLPTQLTNPRNLAFNPAGAGTGSFVGQNLTVTIPQLGVGEVVIITFDVTVANGVANNTVIRNTATVTTNEGPYDEDDASTTVNVTPPGKPARPAPRTGDIEAVETVLFMFIAGATAFVMFSLLKTEKKKGRKK